MNKKIKIIAASALFTFVLTAAPGLSLAKDSVNKWGYWEDLVSPAAGPQVAALAITPTIQDSSPEHIVDPTPVDPIPVDPPEEAPAIYSGYTVVHEGSFPDSGTQPDGVASIKASFDKSGDPDGTAYESQFYKDNEGFAPNGIGSFAYSPFGDTADANKLGDFDSKDMPAEIGVAEEDVNLAQGYDNLGDFDVPQGETRISQWRELTDANGDPSGVFEAEWQQGTDGPQGERLFVAGGVAYYGVVTAQDYLSGEALDRDVIADIGPLNDANIGIDYKNNIQGVYKGFTSAGSTMTVGIDFSNTKFSASVGALANGLGDFVAQGTLNGAKYEATSFAGGFNGLTQSVLPGSALSGILNGAVAEATTGAFDVKLRTVLGNVTRTETYVAHKNGIDKPAL